MSEAPAPYLSAIRQEHHRADAERLVRALFRAKCFACSPYHAEGLWIDYSDAAAAGWLGMPESDEDLVAAVLPYLPQALAPTPIPPAWCAARRAEIQAAIDTPSLFLDWPKARTMLLELLAQLKQAERESADERHETIHAERQLHQARQQLAAREVAHEAALDKAATSEVCVLQLYLNGLISESTASGFVAKYTNA